MHENRLLPNGLELRRFSWRNRYFAYVDTPDYLADNLFIKHKVTVHFLREYSRPDSSYHVILCRCRKRDAAAFVQALADLPDKMLICGHADYPQACRDFIAMMKEGYRQLYGKEGDNDEADGAAGKAEQKGPKEVL